MRISKMLAKEFEDKDNELWITEIVSIMDNKTLIQKQFPISNKFKEDEMSKANHEIKDFIREILDLHHFFRML